MLLPAEVSPAPLTRHAGTTWHCKTCCETQCCASLCSGHAEIRGRDMLKSEAGTCFPAEISIASLDCEIFGRETLLCFMFES